MLLSHQILLQHDKTIHSTCCTQWQGSSTNQF